MWCTGRGAAYGNADAFSRRPDAHPEASVAAQEVTGVETVAVRDADALDSNDRAAPEPSDADEEVPEVRRGASRRGTVDTG